MADLDRNLTANNPVQIVGDSEAHRADVDDLKRVYSRVTPANVLYTFAYLANGAVVNMNVNGLVTPQNFNYTVATTTKYLESITVYLSDDANFTDNGIGGIAVGLTNGILFTYQSKGVVGTLVNIQSNIDLISSIHESSFSDVDTGILSTSRIYAATYRFNNVIALVPGDADYFRVTIRDNLTNLEQLRVRVRLWEYNG